VPLADAIIGDGWDAQNFEQKLGRPLIEIPGGVDLETFRRVPTTVREQYGLQEAEIVLYVGRFAPLKNVSLLVEAFALLRQTRPRARLLLVGEGALEGRLRSEARRLGVEQEVVFTGAKPLAELPVVYSAADVFALPSSFDNSPNVLLEAMACELPMVATRVGGVPRYVADAVNGLLVEPGQPQLLAAALGRVLDDAELRARLVAGGLEQVRQGRSWAASARKLVALYEQLLAGAAVEPVGNGG
jgi:glycosyltransferase involved in cell wall biosynthesis